MPVVYEELRSIATAHLALEGRGHLLAPADLVHEGYMRLVACQGAHWPSRGHFLAMASKVMRNLIVDLARRGKVADGFLQDLRLSLRQGEESRSFDVVELADAFSALSRVDQELGRIAELRCLGGLSCGEVAAVLGSSSRTVDRRWAVARAWLRERLHA